MLASVTSLPSRTGSAEQALVAFRAARLQSCLSQLHGTGSVGGRLLAARALLRLGDARAARTTLATIAAESHRDRAEAALLLAVAQTRSGDDEAASESFRDAYAYSVSATNLALESEVAFYRGLTALRDGDLTAARDCCERALDVARTPTRFTCARGFIPLDHVLSRTEELLGVIAAADGRYDDFLRHARAALATLDRSGVPDVFQAGFALKNLAILARDFDIAEDARMLAERVPSLAWTDDISRVEFTTVEALGWCAALRGDAVGALRWFRRAETAASTAPERILVGVDRALVAREFGHVPLVVEEIERALDLADAFDWETAAGDYRVALLTLAQAAAAVAPARARAALDTYTNIRNAMDATFAARHEPRARAEEAYTHGLVLRAEGRIAASTERLTAAFTTWEAIGYAWRAGRAALELTELQAGDVFRVAVRRELFARPDSVFSARARLVA